MRLARGMVPFATRRKRSSSRKQTHIQRRRPPAIARPWLARLPKPGDDYYSTTAISDYAVRFLKEHAREHTADPFFLFLAPHAPHFPLLPLGNAGNLTAYWAGYREYHGNGRSKKLPAMLGFQAAGAAPIFHDKIIERPETIASAIRIGNPASWKQARAAIDQPDRLHLHAHRRARPRRGIE